MIDLEISLVKLFHWNLHDIDETSIDSLLPFIYRFTNTNQKQTNTKTYCDQADWL